MSRKTIRKDWGTCFRARAAWGLTAVLLLVGSSSPLLGCDDGIAVPDPENNPGLVADCKVLLSIVDELAGDAPLNWSPNRAITLWNGVKVSGSPRRVTVLAPFDYQLTGSIPAALGQLSYLEGLDLKNNQLHGGIPEELGQLSRLTWLELSKNPLGGNIPETLGQLSQLQILWLRENQLTGEIPEELGQLSQLQVLQLSENQLTGEIPEELGQLSKLTRLELYKNQLSGNIPETLGQLSQLTRLHLGDNGLTGQIPAAFSQLSQLEYLALSNNQLTGQVRPGLGQLFELTHLYLSHNRLTGEIPVELSRLSRVKNLLLGYNQLSGGIPPELGQLKALNRLSLSTNDLTGEIPPELGQLSELTHLFLFGNRLTGEIPVELGQLSNLAWLNLFDNRLTGQIPPELGQLSRLESLTLAQNQLTGEIPAELGELSQLVSMYLFNNELSGEIPEELGQLSNLGWLYLNNNQLTGQIPAELGQLSRLRQLHLYNNGLTGEIPAQLGQLPSLAGLFLSNNQLTGSIPPELGQLPYLSILNLQNNRLTGPIPPELGQSPLLSRLVLSGNQLTGEIPPELGQVPWLGWLYLDNNRLTGRIPPELGQLSRLVRLHLQHNQLTGPIPAELGQLSYLMEFSFRGNLLPGSVPPGLSHLPDVYVLHLTATRSAVDRIDVSWDDPGDAAASYHYRLRDENETWTEWVSIGDPAAMLRMGEGVTIEWTLTGLPADVVYDQIEIRVSNATGQSTAAAVVQHKVVLAVSRPDPEGSLFVPVLLTSAGRNNAYFTSELTLTNRGSQEATLHFTYTAHAGGGSGTATDTVAPGQQRIQRDAIGYLTGLGIPIPGSGNRIGTLRVEVSSTSQVSVTTRTTTDVPDGNAGLAYPGIAEDEGFQEAVYLCGLRENNQDRSNLAVQNMGASNDGPITLRTTVYSGEADDTDPRVLGDLELKPGEFHQYNRVLKAVGSWAQGYVKVEKVAGTAPFYAYGVINDNFNSDGSFVFPVTGSSLVGTRGQTLPVIIETGNFQSELTLTNFSASEKTVDFSFVADAVDRGDDTAAFSLTLKAGEQRVLPGIVEELRRMEVEGIGRAGRAFVGALFATPAEGDLSGIVIGARTGAPDKRGGQYSLFYNGVPYGSASVESAWIYGLQQNAENRSNLALVNTGEIDDSSSTFEITIYDGSGETQPRTKSVTLGPHRWTQENGILGSIGQGYVRVRKTSGSNPFVAYGVINDGGRPGERSGDGAFLLSQE